MQTSRSVGNMPAAICLSKTGCTADFFESEKRLAALRRYHNIRTRVVCETVSASFFRLRSIPSSPGKGIGQRGNGAVALGRMRSGNGLFFTVGNAFCRLVKTRPFPQRKQRSTVFGLGPLRLAGTHDAFRLSASVRATDAAMRERCVRPWGKLPSISDETVSYSSEKRSRSLPAVSAVSKTARASSRRPW